MCVLIALVVDVQLLYSVYAQDRSNAQSSCAGLFIGECMCFWLYVCVCACVRTCVYMFTCILMYVHLMVKTGTFGTMASRYGECIYASYYHMSIS